MEIRIKKRYLQNVALIFLGVFISLLILEIGLRVGGFFVLSIQRHTNAQIGEGKPYRILTLGESTTANMLNYQSSWPEELETILNNKSGIRFEVFNEGIGNIDTTYILEHLEENLDNYGPDMVIAMMGTNDLVLNYTLKDINKNRNFLKNLRVYKLFNRIIEGIKYNFGQKEDFKLSISEKKKISEKHFNEEETRLKEAIAANPKDLRALVRGSAITLAG